MWVRICCPNASDSLRLRQTQFNDTVLVEHETNVHVCARQYIIFNSQSTAKHIRAHACDAHAHISNAPAQIRDNRSPIHVVVVVVGVDGVRLSPRQRAHTVMCVTHSRVCCASEHTYNV